MLRAHLIPAQTLDRLKKMPLCLALPSTPSTPIDLFTTVLAHRLRYAPDERDLVVLQHEVVAAPRVVTPGHTPGSAAGEEVHTASLGTKIS